MSVYFGAFMRKLTIFRLRRKSAKRRRRQRKLRLRLERQNAERLLWVLPRARVRLRARANETFFLNQMHLKAVSHNGRFHWFKKDVK
jgi:hypothetical protein